MHWKNEKWNRRSVIRNWAWPTLPTCIYISSVRYQINITVAPYGFPPTLSTYHLPIVFTPIVTGQGEESLQEWVLPVWHYRDTSETRFPTVAKIQENHRKQKRNSLCFPQNVSKFRYDSLWWTHVMNLVKKQKIMEWYFLCGKANWFRKNKTNLYTQSRRDKSNTDGRDKNDPHK